MEDLFLNKLAKELPKFVQYLSVGGFFLEV